MIESQDIICAPASPQGVGAIGLIRVSGNGCWRLVEKMFSKDISNKQSHTTHFGGFVDLEGVLVDEVLVTIFANGKSYTGEESVEISSHGSPYILRKILSVLTNSGCRVARPGEFTERAFLNGKLDLTQAEAVSDLISSSSKHAHNIALKQLKGSVSGELKILRQKLMDFASLLELELDFSEEDVEFADRTELVELLTQVSNQVSKLANSFELGNALKEGVPVAIVGEPNTGKSTLLNQLLGDERAIVSDIPGTTRDTIEEKINIEGIEYRLIDTAGIREKAEEIEQLGIEKSKEKIIEASIILCVADGARPENRLFTAQWAETLNNEYPDKKILLVVNKSDLIETNEGAGIFLSAKSGSNIDELKGAMTEALVGKIDLANETILSSSRHFSSLNEVNANLKKALDNLRNGVSSDFIALDIRQAMHHFGEVTGEISSDELLGNIFSNFCIGK